MRMATLCLLACLTGCASAPLPEQHLYLLGADSSSSSSGVSTSVQLGQVVLAPYLKRSEIMLQIGPNELRPANYHQWAEPLEHSVRRYLQSRLTGEPNTNNIEVDVFFNIFHGDSSGVVRMEAQYTLRQLEHPSRQSKVALAEAQNQPGYPALVSTQEALLSQLADLIAVDAQQNSQSQR